jgi:hypothetical protein
MSSSHCFLLSFNSAPLVQLEAIAESMQMVAGSIPFCSLLFVFLLLFAALRSLLAPPPCLIPHDRILQRQALRRIPEEKDV